MSNEQIITNDRIDLDMLARAMVASRGCWDLDDMIQVAALTAYRLSRHGVQITLDGAVLAPEALMNVPALSELVEQRAGGAR